MKRLPLYFLLALCCCIFSTCRQEAGPEKRARLDDFYAFYQSIGDSLTSRPQWVRTQTMQQMQTVEDSLEWYYYAAVLLRTYFFTFDLDSATYYFEQGKQFFRRQPETPLLADLSSEYDNLMGNIYARLGKSDSASLYFRQAYEHRLRGVRKEAAADILMNLADVRSRQGRLDQGAFWYRRALFLCDSLGLQDKKTAVFYGLGQIYMTLRDFEQCDYYYEQAGKNYDNMLTYERYIYLNNRGNSYYFREDYPQAMYYFRRCCELVADYPELVFERNLCYLNMGDVFLKMGETDSSAAYLKRCRHFFEEVNSIQALYYLDTQELGLALKTHNLPAAVRALQMEPSSPGIEPDIRLIRYQYLRQYYEEQGNYKEAYHYLRMGIHLADSVRGERVSMRVADAALRYAQDSTLMAQNVLIQKQENEVLELRETRLFWIALFVVALMAGAFILQYSQRKRDLLLARNRRIVSSLRLENLRNRLSPHFIFNVLNREVVSRHEEESKELSALVKLMRRNLELAEQLCVTLAEELDFVQTYLELERRSLGEEFRPEIRIGEEVCPERVMLPSMLIQIPVENAVKHALRGKEGKRLLWITVEKVEKGVMIKVTDNGGGFRPVSRERGTGTGLKVIMQTIQILNMKNKETIDAGVHNILLSDGETGCEVSFLLPVKYDYNI